MDVLNDAESMLSEMISDSYDVALPDFKMPARSGVEIIREFKRLNRSAAVWLFMAFDFPSHESSFDASEREADATIRKPVSG